MRSKFWAAVLAAAAFASSASFEAQASVVNFNNFPDGSFSYMVSGFLADALFAITDTTAYDGYGQNNEAVYFNSAVELNYLTLSTCVGCYAPPTSITVDLYGPGETFLTSQTADPYGTLTFNQSGVTAVVFDFAGGVPSPYGDSEMRAWYDVSDITYTPISATPLPPALSLFAGGLGFVGYLTRRRKRSGKQALAAA